MPYPIPPLDSYTVYGRYECCWCKATLAVFDALGLAVDVRDMAEPVFHREMQIRMYPAEVPNTLPQIFSPSGTPIGGFKELIRYLMARGGSTG